MASVRRSCAVVLLACAAAFLVTVGAQPMDNPILSDPNVVPVYMSPGAQPTVVSCYNQSSPSQAPECMIPVRRCPAGCRDLCYVHCPSCKLVCMCELAGTECYDPRFVGGDGNKFLFHGRRDADFCLLSDANLHINAHFIGKRNFNSISADVHGVLGQTYRSDYVSAGVDMGAKIPVMGGAAKYQVSDIFGTDCEVARFAGEDVVRVGAVDMIDEPADTMCGSGKGSAGLVCKK
ncbi:unnamed protein product [Triticum turgidum subsp. durum]|uniref:Uncharacterized protein n=1 Tax=Triticum turgidum subsp. durum TaxID=4567 RepID=A0A9R1RMY9_TRITD|nr:unnamed protein product [Triticum turgidum subsp. durum]